MKGYIKKEDRKTILFLADDLRLPSGIGTMTRELVVNNAHRYNFVHLGAAVQHPDLGTIFDLSEDINNEIGISDASVIVYPSNGYGDPDTVRLLIERHQVDAIVHFTDPRYWIWLYRMAAELRQRVPVFYYHIWDDLPVPHYNRPYYESCDLLMGISKQSNNIAKMALGDGNYIDLETSPSTEEVSKALPKVCYVPHGISTKYFFPINRNDESVQAMRKQLFGDSDPEFVLLYNNRNIRRKKTSDAILAFKMFYDANPTANARFVLHTQPRDEHGTDLIAVIDALCPDLKDKIIITDTKLTSQDLNILYSSCDAVINVASNEGWGLSSTEAMLTGRVLINNVTGGLQDQCRFEDENGEWINFNEDFTSNHGGKYKNHGNWVKPVFPAGITLQGSLPTPYIFDDHCDIRDIAKAIEYWYGVEASQREAYGLEGREWAMSEEAGFTAEVMAQRFYDATSTVLSNWIPPKRFQLYESTTQGNKYNNKKSGISI